MGVVSDFIEGIDFADHPETCDCARCQMELLATVNLGEVPVCTCDDPFAASFEGNPEGHYVDCPCWGTNYPCDGWNRVR